MVGWIEIEKWKDGKKINSSTFMIIEQNSFFFLNKRLVLYLCPNTNKLGVFLLCFHSLLIQRVRALALPAVLGARKDSQIR